MAFQGDSIFWVEVEKVVPNPFQPRREFDEEKLRELSESIRMYGVLQPLTVTRKEVHTDDGAFYTQYELIAGERRLRASKLAGVDQVPVLIRSGEDTEQEKLELAIIENLQREDLNAVDRALAFKQLAEVFELSHAQVAKKVGRSREYVSNSIRLLALPEVMLNSLKHGDLSEGHARTLLMLKDNPEEQNVVYREILLKKLSVREVERIARKIATDKVRKKSPTDADAHLIELEKEFTDTLGTRVQILKTDFGGKLTIDYFEEADLANLLEVVKSQHAKISAMVQTSPQTPAVATASATVIKEMDEVAASLESLKASTALEESGKDQSAPVPTSPTDGSVSTQTPEPESVSLDSEKVSTQSAQEEAPANTETTENEKKEVTTETPKVTSPAQSSEPASPQTTATDKQIEERVAAAPKADAAASPTGLQAELAAALSQLESEQAPAETIEETITAAAAEYSPDEADLLPAHAAATDALAATSRSPKTEKDKLDDDDIYSIKNFSL